MNRNGIVIIPDGLTSSDWHHDAMHKYKLYILRFILLLSRLLSLTQLHKTNTTLALRVTTHA